MKSRFLMLLTAITLFSALAIPLRLAAQDEQDHNHKYHHYRVVDMGALGGNNSFTPFPAARTLNQAGTAVAEADTSTPDPYAPNCFQTLFGECLVNHALQWKNGSTTDLGALAGVNSSFPAWINDRGLVSGFSENGLIDPLTGFPEVEGVLWKDGKIIPLGTLGGNASYGNAVNNRGQVVGFALNTIPDPFAGTLFVGPFFPIATESHAFLWDTKNGMRDLGTLGSGPDSAAFYVNESGQVVGISYINSTANADNGPICIPNVPTEDPFLWEKGAMTDLGSLGGHCGFPFALNNRGEVVGDSTLAGDASNNVPFLWTKATGMQRLPSVGGTFGEAYSINDAGQIAGWASPPGDTAAHAVLWEKGKAKDLGVLGNASCNIGLWINSREQVVGFAGVDSCNTSNESAFLSEDGGPLVDLNTLVSPNSGVYLAEAKTINDRGEIVGDGFLSNGDVHAFLLIPCDEIHPDVEGCDYSLVKVTAATGVGPAPATQLPAVLSLGSRVPGGMLHRFRFPLGQRNPGFATAPALDQKLEPQTGNEDWEADRTPVSPNWGHGHHGSCEVDSNGKLTGSCVGSQFGFCDIQPSANCLRGKRAIRPALESCGHGFPDRVDLARKCSF